MKISILYDAGADDWTTTDVREVQKSCEAVLIVLERAGHAVNMTAVSRDWTWTESLRETDLVFNLCEGVEGVSRMEYGVASIIEMWDIPMTGASAWTSMICHRKPLLNAFLDSRGLPIPTWRELNDGGDLPSNIPLPAIIKPAEEDASSGIDQGSIITVSDELPRRCETMHRKFGRVFLQQYVDGREFNVGFVGDTILPISEIDFTDMPATSWPIVSFAAKWDPESDESRGTQPVCPAVVDEALGARLLDVARGAWRAVDGHGYGRVDLRVDTDGDPWILEVNPSPDASPDAGLANMARAHGWSYDQLILRIVDAALTAPRIFQPPVEARA